MAEIDLRKLLPNTDALLDKAKKTTAFGHPVETYSKDDILILWMMDVENREKEKAEALKAQDFSREMDRMARRFGG